MGKGKAAGSIEPAITVEMEGSEVEALRGPEFRLFDGCARVHAVISR